MSKQRIDEMKKFMQIAEGNVAEAKVDPKLKKAAKLMQQVVDGLGREWEEIMNGADGDEEELEFAEHVDEDKQDYEKLVKLLLNGRGKQAAKFYDGLDTVSREFIYDHIDNDGITFLQKVFDKLGSDWLFADDDDDDDDDENYSATRALFGYDPLGEGADSDNPDAFECPGCGDIAMVPISTRDGWDDCECENCGHFGTFASLNEEDEYVPCPVCDHEATKSKKGWECGNCGEKFSWVGSPFDNPLSEEKCEKCGREGCECGPDCDCEPVEENYGGDQYEELALDALKALYKNAHDRRTKKVYKNIAGMLKRGDKEGAADLFDNMLGDEYIEVVWTYNDNNRGEALLRVLADGNSWSAQSHLDSLAAGDRQPDLFVTGDDPLKLGEDLDVDGMGYYNVTVSVDGEYPDEAETAVDYDTAVATAKDIAEAWKKGRWKMQTWNKGDAKEWHVRGDDGRMEEWFVVIRVEPTDDADVEAWHGESIELGSIAESVLNEDGYADYVDWEEPGRDEPAATGKSDAIKKAAKELGLDVVDLPMSEPEDIKGFNIDDYPEAEDEELGLRFD
jgi:hypothetical protein